MIFVNQVCILNQNAGTDTMRLRSISEGPGLLSAIAVRARRASGLSGFNGIGGFSDIRQPAQCLAKNV